MSEYYNEMKLKVSPSNVMDLIEELRKLSMEERERLSLETGTRAIYLDEEVQTYREAEEAAALTAAPPGYDLIQLNGLNVGCGDRSVSPYLIPVDISRQPMIGGHAVATANAILADPNNLPFKEESIDFIIALHVLEHIATPAITLRHWLKLLKPGGGIGLVIPDWRYAWDSRTDQSAYGHKWNSTSEVMQDIWAKALSGICVLEKINTLPFAASFDVVLRKPGQFRPFSATEIPLQQKVVHDRFGKPKLKMR